jgi:hypothetical protein
MDVRAVIEEKRLEQGCFYNVKLDDDDAADAGESDAPKKSNVTESRELEESETLKKEND